MPKLTRRTFLTASALAGLAPHSAVASAVANDDMTTLAKETGLIFLFQGDSITDGNRGRSTDPNHSMGHGYAFAVASRVGADFPEYNFQFYNRGVSGNTVTDLQKRWQDDTIAFQPNVLSMLVGINDTDATVNRPAEAIPIGQFETTYRDLLASSQRANPDILFVLGIPFVYPVGKRSENWVRWRDETAKQQDVVRKLGTEFNAVIVDYPAVLDKAIARKDAEYWVWDGIHPTVFAHELMAREWIKQVRSRLTFLKKYRYK